jgi:hypothetical protein
MIRCAEKKRKKVGPVFGYIGRPGPSCCCCFRFVYFISFRFHFVYFPIFPSVGATLFRVSQVECGMIPIEPIRWWNGRTLQFVAQLAHTVTSSLFYLSLSFFLLLLLFLLRHLTHTHTFYIYIYILQWSWRAVCSFRLTSPRSLLSFSDAMASTNPFIYTHRHFSLSELFPPHSILRFSFHCRYSLDGPTEQSDII